MQTATGGRPFGREPDVGRRRLVVSDRRMVADDVVRLGLSNPEGQGLPAWEPGAHIDVVLDDGVTRQYSLCGDPCDTGTWHIAVLLDHEGRGGSRAVHGRLLEGTTVEVVGPRNNFRLDAAPTHLFIAGGIGITPLLPMLRAADAAGRSWRLVYGGRRRSSMAFLDELERFGDRVQVWPEDEMGRPDLVSLAESITGETLVHACGPEALLAAVEEALRLRSAATLRVERFRPKVVEAASDAVAEFTVELSRSGVTVEVGADQSILVAAEGAGVFAGSSCEEGVCGSCATAVLAGIPDHRDSYLTDAERDAGEIMMICVSRSRSERLVLDL